METPSSTRRMTRSQTAALNSSAKNNNFPISRKNEDLEMGMSKSTQKATKQERSALVDITNDSPIVGLAAGTQETPVTAMAKRWSNRCTPGSGEALLRGQVKNLLQKVEEEAEVSKFWPENGTFKNLKGLLASPAGIPAPTPANTPQVLDFSGDDSVKNEGMNQDEMKVFQYAQVVNEIFGGKSEEIVANEITRALFLDFSDKSEVLESSSDCSSVLTYTSETKEMTSLTEDDEASVWSIQVNASTRDEDEEEEKELEQEEEKGGHDEEEYYDNDDDELVDELCEVMSKISVNEEGKKKSDKFKGKHIRFVYDSEDEEIVEEKEEFSDEVLHLKGLPTPKGKHFRFPDEE